MNICDYLHQFSERTERNLYPITDTNQYTTIGILPQEIERYYSQNLLGRSIPQNDGKTIRFKRYETLGE